MNAAQSLTLRQIAIGRNVEVPDACMLAGCRRSTEHFITAHRVLHPDQNEETWYMRTLGYALGGAKGIKTDESALEERVCV